MQRFNLALLVLLMTSPFGEAAGQRASQATDMRLAAERAAAASPQPGDRVVLKVWREPLLSDTALISQRGELILPRIGLINTNDHTIASLQDTVRGRFARYLRDPGIDILVLRRIAVNGEVTRPDVYHVDLSTTLREVIARAGGITATGNPRQVWLVRDGVRTRIPAWDSDESLTSDLRSGDQVVVGRRSWVQQNAISIASVSVLMLSVLIPLTR
jgi:protein involved in polysaccharide export with SLBB domain